MGERADAPLLEVDIEKRLPGFTLRVVFSAGRAPLGILGGSGAGKTMTLRAIAGVETPTQGRIALNGRVLFDSARGINVPSRERQVGLLFQNYALFPHLNVLENICFGLQKHGAAEAGRLVAEQVGRLHLEGLEARYPHELSGGQQQRVALARALAVEPQALLLDEPLSALDTYLRSQVERQLIETLAGFGGVTVYVSHNLEEIYRLCADVVVLDGGCSVAAGPKEKIFRHPPSLAVARLTGCKNLSPARAVGSNRVEAEDWGCQLRVRQDAGSAKHVGIRAHHIRFDGREREENVFPAWVASTSETPFRMTLYLRLHSADGANGAHQMQAEVFKEKWEQLKQLPFPWWVRLDPAHLFIVEQ